MNHFAVQQKLTQNCKSTILQLKKKKTFYKDSSHFSFGPGEVRKGLEMK